jgi:hypothetical protein
MINQFYEGSQDIGYISNILSLGVIVSHNMSFMDFPIQVNTNQMTLEGAFINVNFVAKYPSL